ncbi:MBL fold metallo-hydrolase [Nocardioides nanhaiensis]|uniref:MBL fold metallo-hydrolase n=1 Tax=Nocardioides nanhaiensis TaxID=1476871 RepID=A0ABP8WFD6_9ACTN
MSTRVHHLNCGTFRPPGVGRFVAHVLLVERAQGLLLVDTGFGTGDLAQPRRLGAPFRAFMRPALDAAETALAQVRALGHRPEDVTDIALTHLDLDHVGGIGDFPQARVHVHATELAAARSPKISERMRYVSAQWSHGPHWVEHRADGERWLGFEATQAVGDDVLLVPLHGHSRGHTGVAVPRPGGGWLLHAGDAYFDAGDTATPPAGSRRLAVVQRALAADDAARRANTERLRELRRDHGDEVTVFCAHSAAEYDALAGA